MKKLLAEYLGTFALVFAGTGAIVIDQASGGAISHAGIAMTFGLIVLAMIYTFGDISGAHLNPAVTTAFAAAGRFSWKAVPGYIAAQLLGAFTASGLLRVLFPESGTLGATLPAGAASQSFILEVVLTFLLMLTILSVSTGAKEKGITAGMAIGAVIALEAMFAGPICGASMNPARSLSPAIVSGQLEHLWIYLSRRCSELCSLSRRALACANPVAAVGRAQRIRCRTDERETAARAHLVYGNSCRSHLAEGILRATAGETLRVESAGSKPAGYVHPLAIKAMAEIGIDITGHRSKHLDEFLTQQVETVITVCGNADQVCPMFPGQVNRHHWGFDDPAHARGTEDEQLPVFRRVRDEIRRVFEAYAAGRKDASRQIPP